jgi:hypothetical protein
MSKQSKKYSLNDKRLIKRYLYWCYKTTKEDLDRIDRYFTQLEVDQFMLEDLKNARNGYFSEQEYKTLVDDFAKYMTKKKENVLKQKYADAKGQVIHPQYHYLTKRFTAIERAIHRFLGKEALKEITLAYEEEMTVRILQAREHS